MQAGGERMARGPARDMGQRPPAREIHDDGEHDDADGEGVRVDHGGGAFSLDRPDRDADRQRSKKAGLGQRPDRLYLGAAERVIASAGLSAPRTAKRGQLSSLRAEAPFVDTIFRPTGNNLRSGRVSFSTGA
jgi:hypothetical protein